MSKKHILLIEPDSVLVRIYQTFFEQQGYHVTHARTAQSAITAADAQRPDVVILEMQLPHHSGAAFLYEFRSYADWQAIPVIVHSSLSPRRLAQYEASLKDLGATEQLYKPQTSLQQLMHAVLRQLPVFV